MNRLFWPLFLSVFLFACNNSGEEEAKQTAAQQQLLPPQYYYFPRANVYFDSANKDYLFLANDGVNWQTAKQIPNIVQGLMDKSVLIQAPSDPVWKDNEKHKLVYSALLYATPADTMVKKQLPKPVIRRDSTPDSTTIAEKKRSGVRRFFDRIFGKKDKKKKDTVQEE